MFTKIKTIYSKISVALLLMVAFMLPVFSASAAYFNTASGDYPALQAVNYTKNSSCSTCWSTSVSADAGDIISFFVFYHNTSAETANNVMVKTSLPSLNFNSQNATVSIWGDNAQAKTGSVSINLSSSQTLTFIPGSVQWRPAGGSIQTLANSDNIVSGGVNVGSVAAYQYGKNYSDLGYITFRAQLSNNTNNSGQAPIVTTGVVTNITQSAATFNGTVNPNNSNTSVWFEYGTTQSFGYTTTPQSVGSLNTVQNISASASNLLPNTTYYYRIVAQNTIGTTQGSTLSFTTSNQNNGGSSINAPVVSTGSASNISQNGANLSGTVNPNNSNTSVWFEYGTTQSFGYATTVQSVGSYNSSQNVSASVFNLNSNTTYYYRLVAQNGIATIQGATLSFTTSQNHNGTSGTNSAPVVSTNYATNIGSNYMTLNGSVITNNLPATVWFEYGPTISLGYVAGNQTINAGNYSQNITAYLSNLQQNTTYYYRIVASNSYGTMQGGILNSMTQGSWYYSGNNNYYGNVAPLATTNYVFNLSQNAATLSGSVNPNNSPTTVWFEYGPTYSLGYTIGNQPIGNGNYSQNITTSLTGLQPNSTYYFRVVAQNSYGPVYGNILSFTTTNSGSSVIYTGTNVSGSPVVYTVPATFIYQNSALLNGTSNPNNSSATAWFEWGLTNSLGNTTPASTMGQGSTGLLYSYALTGLNNNTTYYFRSVSQNSYGTSYGAIMSFTTKSSAPVAADSSPSVYVQTSGLNTVKSSGEVSLTPAVDNANPVAGEEITYTLAYRNNGKNPMYNASLKIDLPNEVDYVSSNPQVTTITGNNLSFDLGNLNSQTQGVVNIKVKIKRTTSGGSALVFSSTIDYTNNSEKQSSINAYLTVITKQGATVAASLIDVIGSMFGSWAFNILIGLIIGFGAYHFFVKSKDTDLAS